MEHLRFVLRGRCNTWSTFIEVRGSPATIEYFGRRLVFRGRRSTWSTSGSFCIPRRSTWSTFIEARGSPATIDYFRRRPVFVAGASLGAPRLGAPRALFAWQAQHLEHRQFVLHGRRSTWSIFIQVRGSPATIDCFGRRLVLRGRRSTWSTSGSFCVAGAALGAPHARFHF